MANKKNKKRRRLNHKKSGKHMNDVLRRRRLGSTVNDDANKEYGVPVATAMQLQSTNDLVYEISDDKTMQLIDLYSKEDCLWNSHIEDYKNREKRQLAAEKIATILDLPNFTAKHVMMKFKNLRNSYSQELKKIAHSLNSGATGDDAYVPKVFWFARMDSFIKPHIQGKPPKDEPMIYRHNGATEEWVQVGNAEQLLNPEISLVEASASDDDRSNDSSRKRMRIPIEVPIKKMRAEFQEEQPVSQALKEIQSHLQVLVSQNADYHDTFGKYVASLLKTLPQQKALEIQPQIVSLITRSLIESQECEELARAAGSRSTHHMVMKIDPDEYD